MSSDVGTLLTVAIVALCALFLAVGCVVLLVRGVVRALSPKRTATVTASGNAASVDEPPQDNPPATCWCGAEFVYPDEYKRPPINAGAFAVKLISMGLAGLIVSIVITVVSGSPAGFLLGGAGTVLWCARTIYFAYLQMLPPKPPAGVPSMLCMGPATHWRRMSLDEEVRFEQRQFRRDYEEQKRREERAHQDAAELARREQAAREQEERDRPILERRRQEADERARAGQAELAKQQAERERLQREKDERRREAYERFKREEDARLARLDETSRKQQEDEQARAKLRHTNK